MIEIQSLSKAFAEQILFEDVSFTILPGEKIGLVGRNGHGKSTLLKIMMGEEDADSGKITIPKNYKLGYLNQLIKFTEETVIGEAIKGLREDEKEEVWKCEKILTGLGFKKEDFQKDPKIFSGGYQMRIELAKVLVSNPEMLLLDEPTNFLDIISIRWLEKFLRLWRGEFVIISHDRNFVDSVTTHIIGIHRSKVRKVHGNTRKYYSDISMDEAIHEKRRVNEDKKRKQVEEYISSFRAKARRAKSVQSSMKMLDRMGKIDKLDNVDTLSFSFNSAPFRPPVVMEVDNISFSYTREKPYLFNNISLTIERGDKICIAGANGKGKTTFAKILEGELVPVTGFIKLNPQVISAYYEQGNTAKLEDNRTVEEEVSMAHPTKSKGEARNICGAMMFSGDNALKKISVLSGGERSRVLLAKTLLSPSNLLILDEPTHHLDMESCSALFHAVRDYEGAAVIITHDEFFLHEVATKLIIFLEDRVVVFGGNYSEFLSQVGWNDDVVRKGNTNIVQNKVVSNLNKKDERRLRAQKLSEKREKLGPLEKNIKKLEGDIKSSEKKHEETTQKLIEASEKGDPESIAKCSKEMKHLNVFIEKAYNDLEKALSDYEIAKNDLNN